MKNNHSIFEESQQYLVGGVNSPVRSFISVHGDPKVIRKGLGAHIWDHDDVKYVDFVQSWGAIILGHAHLEVIDYVKEKLMDGFSFGAITEIELHFVKMIIEAMPWIDKVRLVSSGTEAVMSAIRLARGYTKRDKIIKFSGCYHGHSNDLLAQSGSGLSTFSIASSAGVPESHVSSTFIATFNDIQSVKEIFEKEKHSIAAVIIEPVAGNMGTIVPKDNFLTELKNITSQYGALLIFDEVMTGFRICFGGVQKKFKIVPDIICLGKVIGGGFPVAAFCGKAEIMDHLAPLGDVYQAGTLSGHPISLYAGLKTLKILNQLNPYETFFLRFDVWFKQLRNRIIQLQLPIQINSIGSMFTIFFCDQEVYDYQSAKKSNTELFSAWHQLMLRDHVYFPPSQFESAFLSLCHCESILEEVADKIIKNIKQVI